MRRLFLCLLLVGLCTTAISGRAATGRVIKVLPFFVDRDGNHTLTPDLFERDGYQDFLRHHPTRISTMLFDVQWKVKGQPAAPLRLRIELRGTPRAGAATGAILEQPVEPRGRFSHWIGLLLTTAQYKDLGEVTAWRATLWEGNEQIGEQKSFLW
jgi:hypothetical protein